jgi:SRSO17 transposase
VGVYLAYVKNGARLLIDYRLYLPKSWCSDPEKCKSSGVPQSEQTFRTKGELALEMIVDAIRAGHRFTHVCMDGFYGSQPWLLTKLEQMKVTYVGDIQSVSRVYVTKPEYSIPAKKGNRGRDPSRKVVLNTHAVRVDKIIKNITHWKTIKIRESTEGFLIVKFTAVKVWRIDNQISQPLPVWLLIRKELDDSEVKYSFCNAIGIQSWDRLAKMQSDRYWIERSFQDAIALAGMADYQVRNWNAWHHHMSLVLLAMLWITKEQHTMLEDIQEITIQDVVRVIKLILPVKVQTALTVARTILRNHRNRRDSRKSKMNRKMRLNQCSS